MSSQESTAAMDEAAERRAIDALLAMPTWAARVRLPPALERAYVERQRAVALTYMRAYWPGVVASITLIGLLLQVSGVLPDESRHLVLFGFSIFYALTGVVVVSVLVKPLNRYLRLFVGLSAIGGLFAMHFASLLVGEPDPLHVVTQFGVILVTVAVFTIANLLVWQALVCWAIATLVVMLLPAFTVLELDRQVFWVYTGGSLIVAMAVGLEREIRDCTVFLQARLLEIEKKEIDAMAQELARLSRTDPLTGLANRRSFDEALAREWASCQREAAPLGLLFIDVDHFKAYNDHYGHPAGDACLARVAQAIARHGTRARDVVARYGGEEFVAIFPYTDTDGIAGIAARIVDAVDALAIPHAASATAPHATVSVGAASSVPVIGGDVDALVQV